MKESISSREAVLGHHTSAEGGFILPIYILATAASSSSHLCSRAPINNCGLPSFPRFVDYCWVCFDLGRVGLIHNDAIYPSVNRRLRLEPAEAKRATATHTDTQLHTRRNMAASWTCRSPDHLPCL